MFRFLATATMCCMLAACSSIKPMAFDKTTKAIDTSTTSIILMTVEVTRADASRFVPEPFNMALETGAAKSDAERPVFHLNKSADSVQDSGKTVYLARLALVGGQYKLQSVNGVASAFPINGFFTIPLGMDVSIKPNSVTYMGRLKAQMRKRESGEFRAGPMVPLIDQAVAGMVRSTWEVAVEDQSEHDLALFRANYPILKDVAIETGAIPVFNRAVAQRIWEGNDTEKKEEATKAAPVAAPAAAPQ